MLAQIYKQEKNEYDQEMLHPQTAGQPTTPQVREQNIDSHITISTTISAVSSRFSARRQLNFKGMKLKTRPCNPRTFRATKTDKQQLNCISPSPAIHNNYHLLIYSGSIIEPRHVVSNNSAF